MASIDGVMTSLSYRMAGTEREPRGSIALLPSMSAMTSSGSIHGVEQCQVNSTIDNKPVGESAQIVLHITGLQLCEGAFALHFFFQTHRKATV